MDAFEEGVVFNFKIRGANTDNIEGCYLVSKLPAVVDNILYTMTYVDKYKFCKTMKLECPVISPRALFQAVLFDRMWCLEQQFVKPPEMWMPNVVSVRMSPTVDMSRNMAMVVEDRFIAIKQERKRIKEEKLDLISSRSGSVITPPTFLRESVSSSSNVASLPSTEVIYLSD